MKRYKKSKLGLFLKILGSMLGIAGIIVALGIYVKVNSFINNFEMMIGRILSIYGISVFIASLITSGTLWGIALTLDNQIRIEAKLDELYKEKEIEVEIEN